MKNKIKLFLTLWVIFFTFLNVNAQCETIMKFFKDDIYTSKDLVGFAEKDPKKHLIHGSYYIMRKRVSLKT